jgi:uncharacterized protein YndB with AHSA1/START domain
MEGLSIKKKLIHCPNKRAKIRICMKQNTAKKKSAPKKAAKKAIAKAKKTAKTAVKAVKKAQPIKTKAAAKKSAVVKKKASNVKKATPKAVTKKAIAKKSPKTQEIQKVKPAKAVKTAAKTVEKTKAKPVAKGTKVTGTKAVVAPAKSKAVKGMSKAPVAKASKKENAAVAVKPVKTEKSIAKKKSPAEKPKRLIIEPPQLKSQAAMTGKAMNPVTTDLDAGKHKHKYKKFELEFSINSAHHILFNYVATSTGLKEWFADEVLENGDLFTFVWDGAEQQAQLISVREDHHIRFHWLDLPVGTYFEFRLETDELTGDLALIITDFAEDNDGVESGKSLWQTQIDALFHLIGAHS